MRFLIFVVLVPMVLIALNLLQLRSQVIKYRLYWSQRVLNSATGDITYIALGDSAAQGVGATKPEKGYVGLLGDTIAKNSGKTIRLINISKSGATIKDVIKEQLPQLKKLSSDNTVITLDIGANDIVHGLSQDEISSQFDELFSQLPQQAIVSDLPSFAKTRFKSREPKIQTANVLINDVAKKHGFKLAPLHEVTKSKNNWFSNAADLFHPNDAAYQNWASAFEPQVLETIK